MKNAVKTSVLLLILASSLSGCMDRTVERITYKANVPVYMPFAEFRTSFQKSDTVEITHPGKIYFKDGYLFVNEYGKGIHVIDNSDPANPQKIAFYKIMGNIDMAIKGNILYADSFIDLVAIDITDINNPKEIGRLTNVFPEVVPEGDVWFPYAMVDKTKGVIIDWETKTVTDTAGTIQHRNFNCAWQAVVLQAIIRQNDIHRRLLDKKMSRCQTIAPYHNRATGYTDKQQRLIAYQ